MTKIKRLTPVLAMIALSCGPVGPEQVQRAGSEHGTARNLLKNSSFDQGRSFWHTLDQSRVGKLVKEVGDYEFQDGSFRFQGGYRHLPGEGGEKLVGVFQYVKVDAQAGDTLVFGASCVTRGWARSSVHLTMSAGGGGFEDNGAHFNGVPLIFFPGPDSSEGSAMEARFQLNADVDEIGFYVTARSFIGGGAEGDGEGWYGFEVRDAWLIVE